MSRAFVKDAEDGNGEELPDRLISPHPNLVTMEGLAQIEAEVARLTRAYAEAQSSADRATLAVTARDLRYWTARRASAEVIVPPTEAQDVHFGTTVTFVREDGRKQTFRIVGEDEADPLKGTLSYVSPLARALMGKAVGDTAQMGNGAVRIIEIR